MNAFVKYLLLAAWLSITIARKSQIDVTIMVPGIEGFRNLTRRIEQMRNNQPNTANPNNDAIVNDSDCQRECSEIADCDCVGVEGQKRNLIDILNNEKYFSYFWSYVFIKPALNAALKSIEQTEKLLDGYQIALHYYDSGDDIGKASPRWFVKAISH